MRQAETRIHEALREALVNTLVHADHLASYSIKVVKSKDGFVFSNPGLLRIPLKQLYKGGVSDPRNPTLLRMFQFLGLGERAGSGFEKILRAWREQDWQEPLVEENVALSLTRVSLPLTRVLAQHIENDLKKIVGDEAYTTLDELSRLILVLAYQHGRVRNIDVQQHTSKHSQEVGGQLAKLVSYGWLSKGGKSGAGRFYFLTNHGSKSSLFNQEMDSESKEVTAEVTAEVTVEVKLLMGVLQGAMSRKVLQERLGLSHSEHFRKAYLLAALDAGVIEMTIPEKKTSRLQRYRLTQQGQSYKDKS